MRTRGTLLTGTAHDDLVHLTEAATVRIHAGPPGYAPDGSPSAPAPLLGSGVFAAPGLVLTCAHVLQHGVEGEVVTVAYELAPSGPAVVEHATVAAVLGHSGSRAPVQPDLAVLRLSHTRTHPCVLLSLGAARTYDKARAVSFGWQPDRETWTRTRDEITVVSVRYRGTAGELIRFSGPPPSPGMSGGPVLDPETGTIVGVIKSSVRESSHTAEQAGGAFVDLTHLNRLQAGHPGLHHELTSGHDRFHHDALLLSPPLGTWTDAQHKLRDERSRAGRTPPPELGPTDRVRVLHHLGVLPPPTDQSALTSEVQRLRRSTGMVQARLWRDGIGLLHGIHNDRASMLRVHAEYVVWVLEHAGHATTPAQQKSVTELRRWVKTQATQLDPHTRRELVNRLANAPHPRPPAPGGAPPGPDESRSEAHPRAVLLEVTADGWADDTCTWRVLVDDQGDHPPRPVAEDRSGTLLGDLAPSVVSDLEQGFALMDLPERPAVLQVLLPRHLLGLAPQDWATTCGQRIGAMRPVVVACADRQPDAPREECRTRHWQTLHCKHGLFCNIVDCQDGNARDVMQLGDQLAAMRPRTVPVLCRHGDDAEGLRSVVDAGYPVALWRRRSEQTRLLDESVGEVCGEFHRRLHGEFAGLHTAADLPSRVHRWRALAAGDDHDYHWSTGLSLFYDPPRRREDPLPAL